MRRSSIIAKDYKGRALLRKIWQVTDAGVLVTTDDLMNRLLNGDHSIFAIGFPLEDCFNYDDSVCKSYWQVFEFTTLIRFAL